MRHLLQDALVINDPRPVDVEGKVDTGLTVQVMPPSTPWGPVRWAPTLPCTRVPS